MLAPRYQDLACPMADGPTHRAHGVVQKTFLRILTFSRSSPGTCFNCIVGNVGGGLLDPSQRSSCDGVDDAKQSSKDPKPRSFHSPKEPNSNGDPQDKVRHSQDYHTSSDIESIWTEYPEQRAVDPSDNVHKVSGGIG